MEKICDCGCGQKPTHQFANGKWIALRLYEKSPHGGGPKNLDNVLSSESA